MTVKIDIERIGEAIDHLMTAPISNWTILKGLPLAQLHAEAVRIANGSVSLAAAKKLIETVKPADTVLILSGFVMRDYGRPETDGPIGAAVLARSLSLALGARPIGISEDICLPCMEACFSAAGLIPADFSEMGAGRNKCAFARFPVDEAAAKKEADEILDKFKPRALVAIERPGAGKDGNYHGGGGFSISSFTAKTDILFEEARARNILTIGIGDLGNELGMGALAEIVEREIPLGDVIAARQPADVTVVANISNWGAYGVAACIAALTQDVASFHDAELELKLIEACVRAGAIDPVGGQLRAFVDGTDGKTNAALVELMRSVVRQGSDEGHHITNYQDSWHEDGSKQQ